MDPIRHYRSLVDRRIGRRDEIRSSLREAKHSLRSLRKELDSIEQARAVIQEAGKKTQERLQYHLSEIAKLALATVFPDDPYEFEVSLETRRGRTEADFWFLRGGERLDPRGSVGLGAVDIVGMSLRASLWSLARPRPRATLWMDEPFKHLKGQAANRLALQIFQELCAPRRKGKWPGLQMVMIADERATREELKEVADRIFEVRKEGRRSVVEVIPS